MLFEDRRPDLFGRVPDVNFLVDRAHSRGFTAVVARPQMGKSWLLTEVARVLTTERGHLVGYACSVGETTGLMAQALSDLYVRWLTDCSHRERAQERWACRPGGLSETTVQAVDRIFEGLRKLDKWGEITTSVVLRNVVDEAFDRLSNHGARLRLPRLDDEQARELASLAAHLSEKPVTLVLDAWEQSPSLAWEYPTLHAFLGRLEGSCDCHVFVSLRPDGTGWVEELQITSAAAHVFHLPVMHLGHGDERGRLVHSIRERLPAARLVTSGELLAMVQNFPGVLERWLREQGRGRMTGPADLRREAEHARHYRHAEFDDLLPKLPADERRLAMRLALLPPVNHEAAEVYRDILFESLDAGLVSGLQAKGVLVGLGAPVYGHETRHVAARLWFLKHCRSLAVVEAEALMLHLARQLSETGPRAWPLLFALASLARVAGEFNLNRGVQATGSAALMLCPGSGSDFADMRLLRGAGRAVIQREQRLAPLVGQALFNGLIRASLQGDLSQREGILNDLRGLHRGWPEDSDLREWLALGLLSIPREGAGEGSEAACVEVLDELRGLHRGWPEHAVIGEWLALGLLGALVDAAEENDLAERDDFLNELRRLHRGRPGDAIVREAFVLGLVNALVDASEEGDVEARAYFLDELSCLQRGWPDDTTVRAALSLDP